MHNIFSTDTALQTCHNSNTDKCFCTTDECWEAAFYQINIMIKNSPTQSQSCASEINLAFHLRKRQESVTCNNPLVWSSDSTSATHKNDQTTFLLILLFQEEMVGVISVCSAALLLHAPHFLCLMQGTGSVSPFCGVICHLHTPNPPLLKGSTCGKLNGFREVLANSQIARKSRDIQFICLVNVNYSFYLEHSVHLYFLVLIYFM